jgi:hypothetical protein
MKVTTFKLSIIIILFSISFSNAQNYYSKLNNLFLYEEQESVFNNETIFFRVGLRKYFNKLFYCNLQTSNNGSSANSASFYSLKIIPRFIFETDFFDENIKLKFNVGDDTSKYPSFPVIYNEIVSKEENAKEGSGNMTLNKGSISLEFSNKLMNSSSKMLVEFLIDRIDYKFKNNIYEIELNGQFTNDVKINKSKISKDSNRTIKIIVKNNNFTLLVPVEQKELKLIEKTIAKDDFKN